MILEGSFGLLGILRGANLNTTSDQLIRIACSSTGKYIIRRILVTNASISLTTAAGGLYTGASKTGTTVVAAGQVYSTLTSSVKFLDLTIAVTEVLTADALYLSLTTAQGATATADVYIYGELLSL